MMVRAVRFIRFVDESAEVSRCRELTPQCCVSSSPETKVLTQNRDKSEARSSINKTGASKQRDTLKKKKAPSKKPQIPNVIYVGHLPKDCEERELIGFLKQFGRLVQVRVCRSHKTGGSKGYAFVKFQSADVAAIVAETMNGHLLFQKRLVAHVLAPEQIHSKLFSANTRTVFQRKTISKDRDPKSTTTTAEEVSRRLLEREQQKRDKLKSLGIEYDFPGYQAQVNKATKSTAVEDDKKSRDSPKVDKKTVNKQAESKFDTPKAKEESKRKRSMSEDGGKQIDTKEAEITTKEPKDKAKRKRSFSGEEEQLSQKKADTPKDPKEKPKSKKPHKEQASPKEERKQETELPQSEKKAKKKKSKKEKKSRKSFP
jgi:nucleolar protein 15